MRSYSTNPQIWDESDPCEHEWSDPSGYIGHRGKKGQVPQTKWALNTSYPQHTGAGQRVCSRCGAWWGELGLEPTIEAYVAHIVEVCREIGRVLRPDGTFWLNLGDSYARDQSKGQHRPGQNGRCSRHAFDEGAGRSGAATGGGLKPKDLVMVPARVALALQADGWYLRNDIVWRRMNAKPESVRDRFSMDYEHVFLLTKSERYYFDQDAVREQHSSPTEDIAKQRKGKRYGTQGYAKAMGATSSPGRDNFGGLGFAAGGRNRRCVWLDDSRHLRLREGLSAEEQKRVAAALKEFCEPAEEDLSSIWSINTQPTKAAHFACFPGNLVKIPLLAGNSAGGCCNFDIKKLRLRPDLTEEERTKVYARLGKRALIG